MKLKIESQESEIKKEERVHLENKNRKKESLQLESEIRKEKTCT